MQFTHNNYTIKKHILGYWSATNGVRYIQASNLDRIFKLIE